MADGRRRKKYDKVEKMTMDIILKDICKSFDGKVVLNNFSATFPGGVTTCITGPSGCGKSTLLGIIAGVVKPDSGTLEGTAGRSMAFAFQEPRLLPWKTVLENVEFVLPAQMDGAQRRERALEALETVEMAGSAGEWPASLSGGMAQRVSLARALATGADILLLDEPFSALDAELKRRVISRLTERWANNGTTVLAVTHLPEEFEQTRIIRVCSNDITV